MRQPKCSTDIGKMAIYSVLQPHLYCYNSLHGKGWLAFYTVSGKSGTIFLHETLPNGDRFSKFFHRKKDLAVNFSQNDNKISHHTSNEPLHYLVKLMSEKQQQPVTCIMINDASQLSVATWFRCNGTFDQNVITNSLLSLFWNFLNRSTFGKDVGKVDCLKRRVRPWTVPLTDELAWYLTSDGQKLLWQHRVTTTVTVVGLLLNNLDSVINKCQAGVMSTTCDSPTDATSDWTLLYAQAFLSRGPSSWLMDMRTVGHYGRGQTIIFLPCDFYILSIFFFPRLISAVEDWLSNILPTWYDLSANLECMSEMWCTRLAENTGLKNDAKIAIWAPSHNFVARVFATKARIDNRKKTC